MAGCKIPGSWGRPGSPPIDEGTLCLWATNPPRILESGPLVVDGTLLEETIHTLFRLTICEALRRGAKDGDLSQLRMRYLWSRQTSGRIQDDLSRELDEDWTESVIAAER